MVLLGTLAFMPFLGVVHHKIYKQVQKRTLWSYGHIFIGRAGIILGMINGGLGLKLANAGRSDKIAYGVIAGLVGVAYLGAIVFGEFKRGAGQSSHKAANSSSTDPDMKQLSRGDSGSDSPHEST